MKALIVDPSKSARKTYALILNQYQIEMHEATSPQEALEKLQTHKYDLLMFAYKMQGMDGLQFFNKLSQRKESYPQVSLLITSTTEHGMTQQAIAAGVTACLSKMNLAAIETFVANFAKSKAVKLQGHVLLVEDSQNAAKVYGHRLQNMGFSYDLCTDAEAALLSIQKNDYDLVITDFNLAGLGDGFAVVNAVRNADDKKSRIPILAVSGLESPTRRAQLLLNGADDFFCKESLLDEFDVRVSHLVANHKLLQKYEAQYQTMQEMATHDALTKLYNRYYLDLVYDDVIRKVKTQCQPLSLMLIDVDYFKSINDQYGHKMGDQVLENLGQLLKSFFADQPLIFRIGGEEFLVILPNVGLAEATRDANELCQFVSDAHLFGLNLTVSIGVASYAAGERYELLFNRADTALSQAKRLGRNQVSHLNLALATVQN